MWADYCREDRFSSCTGAQIHKLGTSREECREDSGECSDSCSRDSFITIEVRGKFCLSYAGVCSSIRHGYIQLSSARTPQSSSRRLLFFLECNRARDPALSCLHLIRALIPRLLSLHFPSLPLPFQPHTCQPSRPLCTTLAQPCYLLHDMLTPHPPDSFVKICFFS